MALALASGLARNFTRLAVGAMVLGSAMASAQSADDLFGIRSSYAAKKMMPICTNGALASAFALGIFGHAATRSVTDDESRAEEALAEELASRTSISVKSARWEGAETSGSCRLGMEVTLPPEHVAELGGRPVLTGDMWFNLEIQNDSWRLVSITDDRGAGDNAFRNYLAPFTVAIVQARLAQADQARFAAEKQRQDQASAVAKRQQDQALAERREWIKTHSAQYAAQQRAEANRRALQAADGRRRRFACEAHGGTWGQTVDELFLRAGPSCHFQIAR